MASKQEAAVRAEARRRRQELDRERDAADARVEERTAGALMAIEARDLAQQQLEARNTELGATLRGLLDEDVPVERAAALTQLSEAEVRRLARSAGAGASAAPASGSRRSADGATLDETRSDLAGTGGGSVAQSGSQAA